MVSQNGALIALARDLKPEQKIHIRRRAPAESSRQGQARIVNQMGREGDGHLYSLEILGDGVDMWGVDFPAVLESSEAVAKMLLECTYCHQREVAYLNEMELRAFESNEGIARHCKKCNVPSTGRRCQTRKRRNHRRAEQKRGAQPRPRMRNPEMESSASGNVCGCKRDSRRASAKVARMTNSPSAKTFRRSACASAASGDSKQTRRSKWRFHIRLIRRHFPARACGVFGGIAEGWIVPARNGVSPSGTESALTRRRDLRTAAYLTIATGERSPNLRV